MREITEVKIEVDSKIVTKIANMNEIKDKIIKLMGENCEKYYFWGEICGKSDLSREYSWIARLSSFNPYNSFNQKIEVA